MPAKIIVAIALFVSLFSAPLLVDSKAANNSLDFLTLEERIWLAEHPILRLAPDPEFAPIEFIDKKGRFRGMAADFLAQVEKILGIHFTIVRLKSWDEVLRRAQTREIDMFGAATNTPIRSEYMTFTKPYIVLPGSIIVRNDVEGSFDMKKIQGMKVAVVSGYMWQEFIQKDYPNFKFNLVPDIQTGLRQVSFGTSDAFVGNLATATHYIHEEKITNLRVAGNTGYSAPLATGVRKDWPILISILEKSLNRISPEDKKKIKDKWISLKQQPWALEKSIMVGIIVFFMLAAFVSTDKYVHERIKSREAIEHSKEMIARAGKLSSLGTLTAGAAHEILNPANIVGMHAQRLMRTNEEGSREYKSAKVIYDSVGRINQICDDLRRFSRNEPTAFKPFNPNKITRNSLNLLLHELRLESIRVELNVDNEDQQISGDPNQIQQVLFNLIGNAKDAMPNGGNLIITTLETSKENKKWWECRVMDTGSGIPEDIMPNLFDPFFTTKPEDKGTGLGLSVTYGIIENHGGAIWAESKTGSGSTFIIQLPAHGTA
ncbi:MAG: transporter substrate-binding domain-containing protein [Nitrospinaceae bacterium]|jgi:two-component system, sensor histidine kinase and response regulator|nr:transporter substrate-binding domain-containing protein [Nitrospinaceae bacterium]MBT3433264.1 transporter substrate-binding domain-containing protein [Nitrospinaceae bacterium]MBT3823286.1 transporter substrate-binding domain-containing protein [Nitrospinaceae bacterium]MBT4092991.1 transporter substrate-binding domain-containing protein [Nitrospinaceae bacterium]MBT4432637.1 transporter substrate-binding domain-containing protein [Nitrospinaceae bacterium]